MYKFNKQPENKNIFIVVINYGNKSSSNISAVLNALGYFNVVLHPYEYPGTKPTHIILSGGPKHVYDPDAYILPQWIINSDIPTLGICYGMQLIAHTFGGNIDRMDRLEKGLVKIREMINDVEVIGNKWMNRYDYVSCLPNKFIITGMTSNNHIAAFTDNIKWWAVQYHPESHKSIDYDTFIRFISK